MQSLDNYVLIGNIHRILIVKYIVIATFILPIKEQRTEAANFRNQFSN